jgi:SurA-like N-terminal domain
MKPRLPMILVAVVAVLAVAGVIAAGVAAGVGFSPVAYRVNGTEVAQTTIDQELSWIAGSPAIRANAQQQGTTVSNTTGSITSALSASWLSQRIEGELLRQEADRRKVGVTDAARAKARKQIDQQVKGAPASLRDALTDYNVYLAALDVSSSDLGSFLSGVAKRSDISVDPRYGFWNPRQGVCPPTGCASSSATGG